MALWPLYRAPSPWPASSPASVWSTSALNQAPRSLPVRRPTRDLAPSPSAWWCCVDHTRPKPHSHHQQLHENIQQQSRDTISGFLYAPRSWKDPSSPLVLCLLLALSARLFSHTLPQPLCTIRESLHPVPLQTPVRPFPMHPLISLNPILLLIWIPIFTQWHCLCVCAALAYFKMLFSLQRVNQNSTCSHLQRYRLSV